MSEAKFEIGSFEIPLRSRQQIRDLHASQWSGMIEEVGTGGWVQTLLQSEEGASSTLWSSHCHYHRLAQHQHYGVAARSIAAETVLAWANQNWQAGPDSFSLALSGSVESSGQRGDCHAWLCLQRSSQPGQQTPAHAKRWLIHLRLRGHNRQQQQISLGLFGIALLHTLLLQAEPEPEHLNPAWQDWIEIDVWQALHQTAFVNYQTAAKLVKLGWSELILFLPKQGQDKPDLQPMRYLDVLRAKKVLWHKGAFNPVTLAHLEMPKSVLAQEPDLQTVLEISLNNFDKTARTEHDLAHQLAMLAYQPWPIALSLMPAFYRTQEWLRDQAQVSQTQFVCGDDLWQRILMPGYYQHLAGGLNEGLERLFSDQTQIWVCKRDLTSLASQNNLTPEAYQQQVHALDLQMPMASSEIRQAIAAGQPHWQDNLLPTVSDYIQTQRLYQALD